MENFLDRSELSELYYITPINNVESILNYGILCNKKANKVKHESIADIKIQDIREGKKVPGGLPLHEYVNLYFCARNPMLFKRRNFHLKICVLRINPDILDLPNVVIAVGNAASDNTSFWASPFGLTKIDKDLVYAEWWTDNDIIQEMKKKRIKCSELLVPYKVDSIYINGAIVSCKESEIYLKSANFTLPIEINSYLFFL